MIKAVSNPYSTRSRFSFDGTAQGKSISIMLVTIWSQTHQVVRKKNTSFACQIPCMRYPAVGGVSTVSRLRYVYNLQNIGVLGVGSRIHGVHPEGHVRTEEISCDFIPDGSSRIFSAGARSSFRGTLDPSARR